MAASSVCAKCGFSNQPGYAFCSNCGNPLTVAAPPSGAPPAYAPPYGAQPMPAYGFGGSPWAYERTKQIDRTKTGAILLLIGAILGWIPLVQLIGYLLIFIGAILVFMGRKAFANPHPRNATLSLVFIIVGIIGFIAVFVIFFIALFGAAATIDPANPVAAVNAIAGALNIFLIGEIVVIAIFGLALLLVTYSLQKPTGRIVLSAAYGAGLALQIAIYAIIASRIGAILAGVITSGSVQDVEALTNEASTLGYLSVVSWALFAAAYYLAWSRISRGEIPVSSAPPPMPGMPPPVPPVAPPLQPQ